MEKTILEWFEEAKANGAEWADAAIKNTNRINLNLKAKTLSQALDSAFEWNYRDEGLFYWFSIYDAIHTLEQAEKNA
jgi:hypothetical protein